MFGGANGSYLADTWEWDGVAWQNVTPPGVSPGARVQHAMAYDSVRKRVVLFGGEAPSGTKLGDLWEWDGATWKALSWTGSAPEGRRSAGIEFDPIRKKLVVFGGVGNINMLGDTWTWNGVSWTDASPAGSPSARQDASLAFDYVRGRGDCS